MQMIRPIAAMPALIVMLSVMLAFSPDAMAGEARGETDRPPDSGGYTQSLGMPPIWKGDAGFELTGDTHQELSRLPTWPGIRSPGYNDLSWINCGAITGGLAYRSNLMEISFLYKCSGRAGSIHS